MSTSYRPLTFLNNRDREVSFCQRKRETNFMPLIYKQKSEIRAKAFELVLCFKLPASYIPSLYTDVVLFFFSFFSKTSASSRAKRAQSAEREKEKYRTFIFFFSHHYLLALAVNKSLKKIEGLWTGYYIPDPPRNPGRRVRAPLKAPALEAAVTYAESQFCLKLTRERSTPSSFDSETGKKQMGIIIKKKSFVVAQ